MLLVLIYLFGYIYLVKPIAEKSNKLLGKGAYSAFAAYSIYLFIIV